MEIEKRKAFWKMILWTGILMLLAFGPEIVKQVYLLGDTSYEELSILLDGGEVRFLFVVLAGSLQWLVPTIGTLYIFRVLESKTKYRIIKILVLLIAYCLIIMLSILYVNWWGSNIADKLNPSNSKIIILNLTPKDMAEFMTVIQAATVAMALYAWEKALTKWNRIRNGIEHINKNMEKIEAERKVKYERKKLSRYKENEEILRAIDKELEKIYGEKSKYSEVEKINISSKLLKDVKKLTKSNYRK